MKKEDKIPPIIGAVVDDLAKKYSESPATTNAGRVLRFISKFVTLDLLLKMVVAKKK